VYKFWWESPKERDHLEDQGVGGKMGSEWILGRLAERDHLEDQGVGGKMGSEWILGRLAWGRGLDSTGSGHGPVAGCCECGDEPSGSCATELVS
jgi:hypothetical protein